MKETDRRRQTRVTHPFGYRIGVARVLLLASCMFALSWQVTAQPAASAAAVSGGRTTRYSVTLDNLGATISDIVDRVVLRRTEDDLVVDSTTFSRRPYELSDGSVVTQTPRYEPNVYIRQVIENPTADRTLVYLPSSAVGGSALAARVRALADIVRLNPGRDVVVFLDEPAGKTVERARAMLTEDGAVERLLDARRVHTGVSASVVLLGLEPRVGLDAVIPDVSLAGDTVDDERIRAELDRLRALYVESAREFIDGMLFGQLLIVVELVRRDLRRAYEAATSLTSREIDRVNSLQIRLAERLARENTRQLLAESHQSEVVRLLSQVDSVLRSDSAGLFVKEMRRIDELVTSGFAAAVDPVLNAYEQTMRTAASTSESRGRVDAVVSAIGRLRPGSIAIVERPREDLPVHVGACVEFGSYNLVVLDDSSADDRSAATLLEQAALVGAAHAGDDVSTPPFVHPAVAGSPGTLSVATLRIMMLERIRLEHDRPLTAGALDQIVVVSYHPLDEAPLNGGAVVSVRDDAAPDGARISHYLLPGRGQRAQTSSVTQLSRSDGLSQSELDVLNAWARIVRAGLDL